MFSFFFWRKPVRIPRIQEKRNATSVFSQPIYNPITNRSLMSPPPISSCFRIFSNSKTNINSGAATISPFKSKIIRWGNNTPSVKRKNPTRTIIATRMALLEMVCFFMSVMDIQHKKPRKNNNKIQCTTIPRLVFCYRGR